MGISRLFSKGSRRKVVQGGGDGGQCSRNEITEPCHGGEGGGGVGVGGGCGDEGGTSTISRGNGGGRLYMGEGNGGSGAAGERGGDGGRWPVQRTKVAFIDESNNNLVVAGVLQSSRRSPPVSLLPGLRQK